MHGNSASTSTNETMNTKKLVRFSYTIVILAVLSIFTIIFIQRHSTDNKSKLVENFSRPGGDTLAVAIEMSPLTYNIAHDTIEGLDYLMLSQMAAKHKVPVCFFPVAQLDQAFEQLYKGQFDLLVSGLPSTARLKEYFPVTSPVYIDRQVLVQRRDSLNGSGSIDSHFQLMGDTVWMAAGKPFKSRLENMIQEMGDTVVVILDQNHSSEHLAIMTALGQIKQAVVGEAEARRIAARYPQLDISLPLSLSQFQVWAVAPDNTALLDTLNSWIEEYVETPQYQQLINRYVSPLQE